MPFFITWRNCGGGHKTRLEGHGTPVPPFDDEPGDQKYSNSYYPQMPISKVWIYLLLFVCVFLLCVFVRIRISPPRITLAASYFAWRLINFAPKNPKIERNGQRAGHAHPDVSITVGMRRRQLCARDAPFVKFKQVCNISRGVWT